MKKLLAILMAFSIGGVAATSVVSCSVPKRTIDQFYDGITIADASTDSEKAIALNGGDNNLNNKNQFADVTSNVLNVLNQTTFSKPTKKEYNKMKELLIGSGAQTDDVDGFNANASVDGLFFAKGDDENVNVAGQTKEEFYAAQANTGIDSLQGIYQASQNGASGVPTVDLNNADVKAFYENYLNGSTDSSFVSASYTAATVAITDSQVNTFKISDDDDKNVTVGTIKDYKDIFTTPIADDAENTIGNKKSDPYAMAVLGSSPVGAPALNVVNDDEDFPDDEVIISSANGNLAQAQTVDIRHSDKNKTNKFNANTTLLGDTTSITIKYIYDLDAKKGAKDDRSDQYEIDVTVDGLVPVYKLSVTTLNKDDTVDGMQASIRWAFYGYQFNSKHDSSSADANQVEKGRYSEMKVSALDIKKAA